MQNINLTPLFQAFIGLLAAVVSWWVIPWIKAHTTEKQQANLAAAARTAVYATQQIYGANREENDAKLRAALEFLRDAGFDFDEAILRQAIEQAVYDMKQAIAREDMHKHVLASFDEESGMGVIAAKVPLAEPEADEEMPRPAEDPESEIQPVEERAAEAVQAEAPAETIEAETVQAEAETVQAEAIGNDPAAELLAEANGTELTDQPAQPPDA